MVRSTTEHDDETSDKESEDGNDLNRSEYELSLSVDRNSENVQQYDDDDDDSDPYRWTVSRGWSQHLFVINDCALHLLFFLIPKVDEKSGSRDLGTKSNGTVVPVVPTDGKTKSRIRITSGILRNSTGKRKPCSHLAETLHHAVDNKTSESVTDEDRDGTSASECTANTKEQTSTNGTAQSDELDVTRLEATLDISIVLCLLDRSIETSCLGERVVLYLADMSSAMVGGRLTTNSIVLLLIVGE